MMEAKKLTATGVIGLGDASPAIVGRQVFQVVDGGSWSGSIVVKARIAGGSKSAPALTNSNNVSVPYINRNDTATLIAAGTAITSAGIYEVESTGVEIYLDYTHTGGTGLVYPIPYLG